MCLRGARTICARDVTQLDFRGEGLNLSRVSAPYRDELESLRAENERLRAELRRRRASRPFLSVAIACLDIGAIVLLRPWLNAPSDASFWMASLFVVLLAIAATAAALGRGPSFR
jgi:VIT1/CCC1 family predicted Fe2+/Mn2+ transporter